MPRPHNSRSLPAPDEPGDKAIRERERREKISGWIAEGVSVPFTIPGVGSVLTRALPKAVEWAYNLPVECTDRDSLYRLGAEILRTADNRIWVVSTIPGEDTPFRPGPAARSQAVRRYFLDLHSIAYLNQTAAQPINIHRYTDLSDPDKYQEALSLLLYGANVIAHPSALPLEFLTDGDFVLIGFPSKTHQLLNGMRVRGPDWCKVMCDWVNAQTDSVAFSSARDATNHHHGANSNSMAATSPPQDDGVPNPTAASISERVHCPDDSCLCRIGPWLPDENLVEFCKQNFDKTGAWYHGLYRGQEHRYNDLLEDLKRALGERDEPSFLDVGCGTAFGARELQQHFAYYGLELSDVMLGEASRAAPGARLYQCDALAALMYSSLSSDRKSRYIQPPERRWKVLPYPKQVPLRDPSAIEQFAVERRSRKFDVIACQGNTFDCFLGPAQQALALCLFDQYLSEEGVLLISGSPFSPDKPCQERLPNALHVRYECEWRGHYMKMIARPGTAPQCEWIRYPCRRDWLTEYLDCLGFGPLPLRSSRDWLIPPGGEQNYLWAYQRRPL